MVNKKIFTKEEKMLRMLSEREREWKRAKGKERERKRKEERYSDEGKFVMREREKNVATSSFKAFPLDKKKTKRRFL